MTTMLERYRIRRPGRPAEPAAEATQPEAAAAPAGSSAAALAAIEREGLTARQLRQARRTARKHGITAASDFEAVYRLREAGIDPFQRSSALTVVRSDALSPLLPGTALDRATPRDPAEERTLHIRRIQREIAARRRRKLALLFVRLAVFILLPTALVGWYYGSVATPMYATKSELVIQQAGAPGGGGGLGSLFQGTSMATQQDSIAVQSYLASREAMLRLDRDHGFIAHFSREEIDPIQRLPDSASMETAFETYEERVRISYDPSEGILRMEVVAADPQTSQTFAEALIGYAEEQVDQLTQRLREDQMQGARESYQAAEERRSAALAKWVALQEATQQIDPAGETAARMSQIAGLESERQRLELTLQSRLNVANPSEVQVNALRSQIADIENLIGELRAGLTVGASGEGSQAIRNSELRLAQENYTFQTMLVQQALSQMEAAQIEANRQVRYLSQSVRPIAPDRASYPKAFENTLIAFFIFSGIYLMLSLTASILREQVSS